MSEVPLQRPTARRLRIIAWAVLVGGLGGACLFYWTMARAAAPTADELIPGYSQQRARQNAIVMGSLVVTLLGWADVLKDPTTEAVIIAGVSVVVALGCFRVAWLLEHTVR